MHCNSSVDRIAQVINAEQNFVLVDFFDREHICPRTLQGLKPY